MPDKTETPRTDAFLAWCWKTDPVVALPSLADFACGLERELAAAEKRAQELAGKMSDLQQNYDFDVTQAAADIATARREERERCAEVCNKFAQRHSGYDEEPLYQTALAISDAIRALPEEGKD